MSDSNFKTGKTAPEVLREELGRIEVFAGLSDDDLDWFISQCEEVRLEAGETFRRAGEPTDYMFVMLEGEMEGKFDAPDKDLFLFEVRAGQVSGRLPFSRMKKGNAVIRAVTQVRALQMHQSKFMDLLGHIPELAGRLVGVMLDRTREMTRIEQQRNKLAALGKLSAGLAHELNNPASAAKRSASQLREALKRIRDASHELGSHELTRTQRARIEAIESEIATAKNCSTDALAASDLEEENDQFLRNNGFENMWQLAGDLAQRGIGPDKIKPLFEEFEAATARAALTRIATSIEIWSLLAEVENSTSRISDLVRAIKEYTYMDQSSRQDVDVVKSVENTLTIMNHKLKKGIEVKREYQPTPLLVNSFGSELNQVWTNLIDNAIDAMNGEGVLTLRIFKEEDDCIVVEVRDNGPGIPAELQPNIFEPFFTTKSVGQGTGLGLDMVRRIVRKHYGHVDFKSSPAGTVFQVRLPISGAPASNAVN